MAGDPYTELGLARGASADEIRKAFRKLAKANHPDANPNNKAAEERFKRASAAFDILGDAEKRKKFDRGEIDADGREQFTGHPFSGGHPFGGAQRGGGDFGGFGGGGQDFSDIFSEILGRGGRRGGGGEAFASKGQDVRARLDIDLEEAIKGGKKRIAFSDGRTLDVTLPSGVSEGQTLRMKGQGAPGRAGSGDALIELHIKPHAVFKREGDGLVMDLPVSVPDAVLGGKVEAPTPDGPVTLTIPRGSNSGALLRLKGRGLADSRGKRGDLVARLMVTLPETSDPELVAFSEGWRSKRPYAPKRR